MLYLTLGTKLISTIHFYKRWGGKKHGNTELEMTGLKAFSYRPIVSSSQVDNHHKEMPSLDFLMMTESCLSVLLSFDPLITYTFSITILKTCCL